MVCLNFKRLNSEQRLRQPQKKNLTTTLLETCRRLYGLLNVFLRHAGCCEALCCRVWFIIVALQQYECMLSFNQASNKLAGSFLDNCSVI